VVKNSLLWYDIFSRYISVYMEVIVMDIPALSMALANVSTANDVGMAVLSKAMDQSEIQGAGLVNMIDAAAMERSVNPSVGSNFDMLV